MALSADTIRKIRDSQQDALRVLNGQTVYKGSYAALNSPNHATSASRGRAQAWASTTEQIPLGLADLQKVGDSGETKHVPIQLADVIVESVAVTGASTQADVGQKIYWSDDETLTLTRPTLGIPMGVIIAFDSSTSFDVVLFGFSTLCSIALGGHGQDILFLGSIVPELGAAADLLNGILAPYHGKLLSVYAICASAPADADMHMDIQVEIDGVNTTGGVITLDFADTVGLKKSGTAITAGAVFKEGSAIDIEALAAGLVAGTVNDGLYNVYAEVERLLGV